MNKSNRKAAVPVIIKRELLDLALLHRADVFELNKCVFCSRRQRKACTKIVIIHFVTYMRRFDCNNTIECSL